MHLSWGEGTRKETDVAGPQDSGKRPEHGAGQMRTGIQGKTRVCPVLGVLGHLNWTLCVDNIFLVESTHFP